MFGLIQRALGPLMKMLTDVIGKALGLISPKLKDAFFDFLESFLGSALGTTLASLFTDGSDKIIAKLEEIRVWLSERFGSGKEAGQDGPLGNTAVSKIEMPGREDTAKDGQDTAPDTQALEEAFAALQEKITDLFDETLTDLIARVEEAVAAVDELLGRGGGTAPDNGGTAPLPGVIPAAASVPAPAPSAGPVILSDGQGRVVRPAADSVAAMQELTVAVDTVLAELSGTMEERLAALLGGLEALLAEQGLSARRRKPTIRRRQPMVASCCRPVVVAAASGGGPFRGGFGDAQGFLALLVVVLLS